jgi:hypothetical protein
MFPLVQWLRLAISKGPNGVDVFLPSPEDGNRSSLRNDVFSSYLQFKTMEKVQKPNDSEYFALRIRVRNDSRIHNYSSAVLSSLNI